MVVTAAMMDDPVRKAAAVRRLADYRYADVAFALVQMLEDELNELSVLLEVEWVIVGMAELALPPLADAISEGTVPADMALLIYIRVARRDPTLVVPYMRHKEPLVARTAALGIALSGHASALAVLLETYELLSVGAQQATLHATCHVDKERCRALLAGALSDGEDDLKITALSLGIARADRTLGRLCSPLLHDENQAVVRAALEALVALGAAGGEEDLIILFDSADDDVREQILRVMSATGSSLAFEFLRGVVQRYSAKTRLGRLAQDLFRSSAGKVVLFAGDDGAVPVEATVRRSGLERHSLVLYNDAGFRVVALGSVMARCQGRRGTWRKVSPDDYSSDGSVPVNLRCPRGKTPDITWKRPDGRQIVPVAE